MTPALSPAPVWRIPPRAPQQPVILDAIYSDKLQAWVTILTAKDTADDCP
jgi:hypothetical protein